MFILLILFLGQIPGTDLKWVFWMGAQAGGAGQDISRKGLTHGCKREGVEWTASATGVNSAVDGHWLHSLPFLYECVHMYTQSVTFRFAWVEHIFALAPRSRRPLMAWHWEQRFCAGDALVVQPQHPDSARTSPPTFVYTLSAVQ